MRRLGMNCPDLDLFFPALVPGKGVSDLLLAAKNATVIPFAS